MLQDIDQPKAEKPFQRDQKYYLSSSLVTWIVFMKLNPGLSVSRSLVEGGTAAAQSQQRLQVVSRTNLAFLIACAHLAHSLPSLLVYTCKHRLILLSCRELADALVLRRKEAVVDIFNMLLGKSPHTNLFWTGISSLEPIQPDLISDFLYSSFPFGVVVPEVRHPSATAGGIKTNSAPSSALPRCA